MHRPLPKKISPCPINEAILEIRFQPNILGDAVFGLVYNEFKKDYPAISKQPVLQIPEQMRITDPGLMHLPEYHLESGPFKLLVGQRIFAIVVTGSYCGWKEFSSRIEDALDRIGNLGLVERVSRLGLRYINVFDFNIFHQSTLSLELGGTPLDTKSSRIVAQIPAGEFEHTLTMVHGMAVRSGESIIGDSAIDIDTSRSTGLAEFFDGRGAMIEEAHKMEKELFFRLITDDYMNTLSPEYEQEHSS